MEYQALTTSKLNAPSSRNEQGSWGAIFAMALCVAVLITSEFMPFSLLSPTASDLGVTEGRIVQAISFSCVFAVLTSLFVSNMIRELRQRERSRRQETVGSWMIAIIEGTDK